jgi:hypothetical protein
LKKHLRIARESRLPAERRFPGRRTKRQPRPLGFEILQFEIFWDLDFGIWKLGLGNWNLEF